MPFWSRQVSLTVQTVFIIIRELENWACCSPFREETVAGQELFSQMELQNGLATEVDRRAAQFVPA